MIKQDTVIEILLEIKGGLGEMSAKIESLEEKLETHSAQSKNTAEKVTQLEKDVWKAKGAIALVLTLGTLVGAFKLLFN
jgi:peptidoglycan hydrolase CwlO-like protein